MQLQHITITHMCNILKRTTCTKKGFGLSKQLVFPGHSPTVLVIHNVPLGVIPRYPSKGLSTYKVLLQCKLSRIQSF